MNCCIFIRKSHGIDPHMETRTVQRLFKAMDWTWVNKGTVPDFPWRWAVVMFTVEFWRLVYVSPQPVSVWFKRKRNEERETEMTVLYEWGRIEEKEEKKKEEGCFWLWLRRGWDDGEKQGGVGHIHSSIMEYHENLLGIIMGELYERTGEQRIGQDKRIIMRIKRNKNSCFFSQ